jgi:hypothetical protein
LTFPTKHAHVLFIEWLIGWFKTQISGHRMANGTCQTF